MMKILMHSELCFINPYFVIGEILEDELIYYEKYFRCFYRIW